MNMDTVEAMQSRYILKAKCIQRTGVAEQIDLPKKQHLS